MRLLLGIISVLFINVAYADEYRPAYLEIKQINENIFDILWKIPAKENGRLDINVKLPPDTKFTTNTRSTFIRGAYIEQSSIDIVGGLKGKKIEIIGLERVSTDVLIRIEWVNGSSETARLNATNKSYTIKGKVNAWQVVKSYLLFGIQHILEGFDHLLFIACLVFIARTWRRILITISGFTLAHSLTLSLASLGAVQLPIPPVEAIIALSIVFLAREITLDRRNTLTWRYPVTISVSFGLLHGFGFASALADIGLPQTEIPAALLAFNLGVEVGQVAFVGSLTLLFLLVSRCQNLVKQFFTGGTSIYQSTVNQTSIYWLEKCVGYSAGSIAMFWTIQRLMGFWV